MLSFDLKGHELARCTLGEEDPRDALGLTHDGLIDVGSGRQRVRFGADGTRQDVRALVADFAVPRPEASGYWGVQDDVLVRCTDDGTIELRHERRPDGQGFTGIAALALASDGSLAVLQGQRSQPESATQALTAAALTLYEPDGETGRVLELPAEVAIDSFSYQGGRVLFADPASAQFLEVKTGRRFVLDLRQLSPSERDVFALSTDGRTLWVLRPSQRGLRGFELPR